MRKHDPDKDPKTGLNATSGGIMKDIVNCGRCGFPCDKKVVQRAPYGSKRGMGISYPSDPTYDQDHTYDSEDMTYDMEGYGYNGHHPDFTITGGCPLCGAYTYDKGAYRG